MSRLRAAAGSLVFLVLAPGVAAGLVPWLVTGWEPESERLPAQIAGIVLIALGAAVLLYAFGSFVIEGLGTPAPVAPPQRLVHHGLYRWVRNPMYLAVGAVIAGQALLFGDPAVALYLAAFALAVWSFVHLYEEPTLASQFGAEYEAYRREVPRWRPRRPAR